MKSGANLVRGVWRAIPGSSQRSFNPAHPSQCVWSGNPQLGEVDEAIASARAAFERWRHWPFERRAAVLRAFAALAREQEDTLTTLIREEIGKPTWDARAEAQLIASKVDITLDPNGPLQRVTDFNLELSPSRQGGCWFRPHGVMAVLGPFNFPAHLPNGHIVPALAMGNTVVFKPSDKAPAVGELLAALLQEALDAEDAPPGVMNLVHGGSDVAKALVAHADVDGVLFTGSWPAGRSIMQANLDRPGRILALEMGGNNAAIIMPDANLRQAVLECVRSAFVTAGQRCTCTRRLIVHRDVGERVLIAMMSAARALAVGDPAAEPANFMGPIISDAARRAILQSQASLLAAGGESLLACRAAPELGDGHFLTPGIIRVPPFQRALNDEEIFGPLLQLSMADSLEDAISQANATSFGLAASIFTTSPDSAAAFHRHARAGCLNVNTGTAGASSRLPFGGLGLSGNHRPAGAFSLDYCAYPVAGMTESSPDAALPPGMAVEEIWFA